MEPVAVTPTLPTSWEEVLGRIEQGLEQAVAAAAAREQALPAFAEPAGEDSPPHGGPRLEELERLVEEAGRGTADVDGALAAGVAVLTQWLGEAAAARQRLAGGAGRAV
jgi:hypothetical protein